MNDILKVSLGFASGTVLGFFGGALYFKKKYESALQKEVDSFKEQYRDEVKKYADSVRALTEEREAHRQAKAEHDEKYGHVISQYAPEEPDDIVEVTDDVDGPLTAKEFKDVEYKNKTIEEYKDYSHSGRVLDETPKVVPRARAEDTYIITPDEFDENPDYDAVTLYYYSDDILADENGEIVDDPDWIIGVGTLESIGLYEDGAITVRNDRKKCDYEILEDTRAFSDVELSKGVK